MLTAEKVREITAKYNCPHDTDEVEMINNEILKAANAGKFSTKVKFKEGNTLKYLINFGYEVYCQPFGRYLICW